MTARVAIAVVLLMLLATLFVLVPTLNVSRWLIGLCSVYLASALAVRMFTRPTQTGHAFDPQWVSTIGVDLVAFSTLQFLQAGGINYTPLFALAGADGLGAGHRACWRWARRPASPCCC